VDEVQAAYVKLFRTPAGKIVLRDLQEKYDRYTTEEGDTVKTYGKSAQRDVYLHIKYLSEGNDE